MPIPPQSSPWPPQHCHEPQQDVTRWAAWYSGSPDRLSAVYGGSQTTAERSFERRGLLGGLWNRMFWGQRTDVGQQRTKLHVPTASDIAAVSADLLFGQPPSITVEDDQTTQDRIDELIGEEVQTKLHEAAEVGAALGHSYLRVGWDLEIDPDGPLVSVVDADAAYPVYAYSRLIEVSFVREWNINGGVLRHLEHHARGLITHALYLGERDNLGRQVPLSEHPETAGLPEEILTGLDMLTVVAVPNAPTRTWRHIPGARDLGRADISGVEPVLDALDDAWSSWLRDLRHGRSRLHVPAHMLESQGRGKGAIADIDRELYVGLNAPPDGDLQLTATQFAIRYQEHAATTSALLERAVTGAGYSPQTFGLETDAALTATESWARQKRTRDTRAGKIRRWRPAIIQLVKIMLAVDRVYFRGNGNPDLRPDVMFPEVVSESQVQMAQSAALMRTAEAASTETLVSMLHGDWDDEAVQAEVAKIKGEQQAAMPVTLSGGFLDDTTGDPNGDPAQDPNAPQAGPADQQQGKQAA